MPPVITGSKPVNRTRWWIHLCLITSYILVVAAIGLIRNKPSYPALTRSAGGLLIVCALELFTFGTIFGLAWVASRASADDLLLRWRGNVLPVIFGVAYSVALRVAVAVTAAVCVAVLVATRVMDLNSVSNFADKNRPDVENVVDVDALRHNPVYFWLVLTLVSFVLAGLREELWRSSFLAGMKKLWPNQFGSMMGQVYAVIIASVIFGAAHLSMGVLAACMAGLLGLGLGLIMIFHRSIWPAVIAHGFFDATSLALIPWALDMMKQIPKH